MSPMTYMIGIHKRDFEKVNDHLSSEDKAEPIIIDLSNTKVDRIFVIISGIVIQKLGHSVAR